MESIHPEFDVLSEYWKARIEARLSRRRDRLEKRRRPWRHTEDERPTVASPFSRRGSARPPRPNR